MMTRLITFILVVCALISCSDKKNGDRKIEPKLEDQGLNCDSIYMNFFLTDSLLKNSPVIDFNGITSMDTLQKIYTSNQGIFNIRFNENKLPREPKIVSARYVHYDSLRCQTHPRVGMPAYFPYEFEFTPDLRYAYCFTCPGNQKVFRRDELFNIIDSLITNKFLGDSISLRKLYSLELTYPIAPNLDEFKIVTQQLRDIHHEILTRVCNRYISDEKKLNFRLWRLAHLRVNLNYDFCMVPWWQFEEPIAEMDSLKRFK